MKISSNINPYPFNLSEYIRKLIKSFSTKETTDQEENVSANPIYRKEMPIFGQCSRSIWGVLTMRENVRKE